MSEEKVEVEKTFRITLSDGMSIEVKNYFPYTKEFPYIIVMKNDVIDDYWKLFQEDTKYLYINMYNVAYIRVNEKEVKK